MNNKSNNTTTKRFPKTDSSGMTLIEMVVVVSIVAVVSSIVIFNYSTFRNNVTVRALAQDVALAIRKAQTYATSVQSIDGSGGGSTVEFPAYGISFSINSTTSPDEATPSRKRFVLFADVDKDGRYDGGNSCGTPGMNDECVESFGIETSDSIVDYCYQEEGASVKVCANGNGAISNKTVDIVFDRPSPDAALCQVTGGGCLTPPPPYAEIVVQAISGNYKTITVWNTGQISVE